MTCIMLPDQHPFLQSGHEIGLICDRFLKRHQAQMFVYGKYYSNGEAILVSNNSTWVRHHLSKGYLSPAPIPAQLLQKSKSYHVIPNDGPFSLAKYDLLKNFDSDQAIDFIRKGDDCYEIFCFSFSSTCRDSINIILNHLDQFEQFTDSFKEQGSSLLRIAENNKIKMEQAMLGIPLNDIKSATNSNTAMHFNLNLTQREREVLRYSVRGKTAKQTAKILQLSHRTIEHYLENIKTKVNASTKSELIEMSFQYFS